MLDRNNFGGWLWQGTWLILPMSPYFNHVTKQVYDRNIFDIMCKAKVTFQELKDFLNNYIEFKNKFFVGSPSNGEYYLQMQDQRFSFGIYDKFHLWDDFSRFLGEYKINIAEPPTEDFVNWITKTCEDYCNNIIKCLLS